MVRDAGAAAVETAFMAMLLIFLVMGLVDVGRVLYTHIGVQDAAQEAAMLASFDPDASDIPDRVAAASTFPDLDTDDIDVGACSGDTITATVTHTVDLITPLIGQFFDGGSVTLTRHFTGEVFEGCPA
jgi:Flp pilus assembly protein TadG